MKQYKFYTTVGIIETNKYTDKYVLHREDGPACIRYHANGSIYCEEWYWCGMRHRHDYTLPASIYDDDGYYYFWYGVQCTPKQILNKDFRDRIALRVLG